MLNLHDPDPWHHAIDFVEMAAAPEMQNFENKDDFAGTAIFNQNRALVLSRLRSAEVDSMEFSPIMARLHLENKIGIKTIRNYAPRKTRTVHKGQNMPDGARMHYHNEFT